MQLLGAHWRGAVLAAAPSKPHCKVQCGASIGIDLGTTNSLVSVIEKGKPRVLADENGAVMLPSVVAYKDGDTQAGQAAIELQQGGCPASRVVHSVKRLVGRQHDAVAHLAQTLSYTVTAGNKGEAIVQLPDQQLINPEAVSAEILKALKHRAEAHLREAANRVVVTIPAHFSKSQRLATIAAAYQASFAHVALLQEPIAAAMAYGLGRGNDDEQSAILVFDLGGGTFDVCLLQSYDGILEVVGSDGDSALGGIDIDNVLADTMLQRGAPGVERQELGADAKSHLLRAACACKEALSRQVRVEYDLALPSANAAHSAHCAGELRTVDMDRAFARVVQRLEAPLCRLAQHYKLHLSLPSAQADEGNVETASDRFAPPLRTVSQLVLVGGSTMCPQVQHFAQAASGCTACSGVDPEHAVAAGAAIHAGNMLGSVAGLEMTDSLYAQSNHDRVSGFQT